MVTVHIFADVVIVWSKLCDTSMFCYFKQFG